MKRFIRDGRIKCACGHSKNGRNLVLFIDGTSNQFGDKNTNVVELHSLVRKEAEDNQLTWYHSGIGTYAQPSLKSAAYYKLVLDNKLDLAVALTFEETVQEAYEWLADNYEQGDCIYLFGFSRGAYQVRALAGMIDKVGLIHRGNKKQIKFAYELYADHKSDVVDKKVGTGRSKAENFKHGFSHKNVRVHFVGVWDTVSSVGLMRGKRMLPRTVDGMKHVCYFRHALALDECRVKFLPEYAYGGRTLVPEEADERQSSQESLSSRSSSSSSSSSSTAVSTSDSQTSYTDAFPHTKEVWFAGTHSDIGGGNVDNPAMDRGRPPLRWMASEATQAGLRLDKFDRELSLKEQVEIIESLTFFWKILEGLPVKRLTYSDEGDGLETTHRPHFGDSRKIKPGQKIHSSVLLADADIKYTPQARPPCDIDPKKFWERLHEGKEDFKKWVEVDMEGFMYHLVKSALAEHNNPLLEDLLLPASAQGSQELYNTVVESLGNSLLVPDTGIKYQLLKSLTDILRKTSSLQKLSLAPSPSAILLVSDLLNSSLQNHRSVAKIFLEEFTDPCTRSFEIPIGANSIAYSPNGRWIGVGLIAGGVLILDAESWEVIWRLTEEEKESTRSIAFSLDCELVAYGSGDGTIRVWNTKTRGEPLVLKGPCEKSSVESLVFSLDKGHLISGSQDKTIRIWNAETGDAVGEPLLGHHNVVTSVMVSPDGALLASASLDQVIRLWDIQTRKFIRAIYHNHAPWSVAFSPDGASLASSCYQDLSIRIWNTKTGQRVGKCKGSKASTDGINAVLFSPDGAWIVSASEDKTVKIFDAQTFKLIRSLEGHTNIVCCLSLSPDGKVLVSSGCDGTIRQWDIEVLMACHRG